MPKACIDSPSWFRAAVQVPPYPRAALGSMRTVPAQIFCAPTRTALIAASRCMPGVCAMLGSRRSPLMAQKAHRCENVHCLISRAPSVCGMAPSSGSFRPECLPMGCCHGTDAQLTLALIGFHVWRGWHTCQPRPAWGLIAEHDTAPRRSATFVPNPLGGGVPSCACWLSVWRRKARRCRKRYRTCSNKSRHCVATSTRRCLA